LCGDVLYFRLTKGEDEWMSILYILRVPRIVFLVSSHVLYITQYNGGIKKVASTGSVLYTVLNSTYQFGNLQKLSIKKF
jgi:hypothetical protein